jgi:hypothetical protein
MTPLKFSHRLGSAKNISNRLVNITQLKFNHQLFLKVFYKWLKGFDKEKVE